MSVPRPTQLAIVMVLSLALVQDGAAMKRIDDQPFIRVVRMQIVEDADKKVPREIHAFRTEACP